MMEHGLLRRIVEEDKEQSLHSTLRDLKLESNAIAVTGIGFGDEGKGRIVHELSLKIMEATGKPVASVFKVNGGANSGHTAAGLKLNLLPSGVAGSTENLVLGRGVVADPNKILWESVPLDKLGYQIHERLVIDERTMVSDLTHRLLDKAHEKMMERDLGVSRGSTGRGISPAFQAETSHTQIFYNSFRGLKSAFANKLLANIAKCEKRIQYEYGLSKKDWNDIFSELTLAEQNANEINSHFFSADEFDFNRFKGEQPFTLNKEEIINTYWDAGCKSAYAVKNVSELISSQLRDGRFVIFEFGQAFLLDKRSGFTPNVTASHTYTPEIFFSAAIPIQRVHNVTAAKAYDTKVGTHIFLTEINEDHPLGRKLREIEFGTTTGRQRMVGWFDAVEKGLTLREGGFNSFVVNKLDALTYSGDWKGELKICSSYLLENGLITNRVPIEDSERLKVKPIYETYQGWSENLTAIRKFEDLPENAKLYVAALYHHTVNNAYANRSSILAEELPKLDFIGVGPDPEEVIYDVPNPYELLNYYYERKTD